MGLLEEPKALTTLVAISFAQLLACDSSTASGTSPIDSLAGASGTRSTNSAGAGNDGTIGADAAGSGTDSGSTAANGCVASGGKCLKQGTGGCLEGNGENCGPGSTEEGIECCTKQLAACIADGSSYPFHASNYDRSCKADSDCVAAGEGDLCEYPCALFCPTSGAISATAAGQYQADIDAVLKGASAVCHCPTALPPRCVDGVCELESRHSVSPGT